MGRWRRRGYGVSSSEDFQPGTCDLWQGGLGSEQPNMKAPEKINPQTRNNAIRFVIVTLFIAITSFRTGCVKANAVPCVYCSAMPGDC